MFGRSSEATRRQSVRSEDISPTRIVPMLNKSGSLCEEQRRHACEEESEIAHREEVEPAREREILCTWDLDNVSGFILASRLADMRLPPDEYFPSRPLRATTNRDNNNLRGYRLADTSGPKSDTSSSCRSESSEEAGEYNENGPRTFRWRPWRRSVQFEDEQGPVSKMYSTLVGRLTFKTGLKPALKNKDKAIPSTHLTPNAGTTLTIVSGFDDEAVAGSESIQLHKGNGEAIAVNDTAAKDVAPVKEAPNLNYEHTAESKPVYKDYGKGKAATADTSVVEVNVSPQWVSIPEDTPIAQIKPVHKDKDQGKAASVEYALRNGSAQTDGSVPDDYCAIDDLPVQQYIPPPKTSTLSDSRTPSLERLQDHSDRTTSGEPCGMLRTGSPKCRPLPDAHPKTSYYTFPTQPLHPVKPSLQNQYLTVRHYDGGSSDFSAADPPLSTGFTSAIPILVRNKLLTDKLEVQNSVKEQLRFKKMPSPTHRTTKSLTETVVGFLYSDKDKLNPIEERSSLGDDVLN